jgi:hypothetical protein
MLVKAILNTPGKEEPRYFGFWILDFVVSAQSNDFEFRILYPKL